MQRAFNVHITRTPGGNYIFGGFNIPADLRYMHPSGRDLTCDGLSILRILGAGEAMSRGDLVSRTFPTPWAAEAFCKKRSPAANIS